jgi:hypothetical protein
MSLFWRKSRYRLNHLVESDHSESDRVLHWNRTYCSLSTLSLSGCRLSESAIEALCAGFCELKHLRTLELGSDQLGPGTFTSICRALILNKELTTFSWEGNQLGDIPAFGDLVRSTESLRFLTKTCTILVFLCVESIKSHATSNEKFSLRTS